MGDSAGGNLAAVVAVMARDRGGPPIALQVLLYPAVDLRQRLPVRGRERVRARSSARPTCSVQRACTARADEREPYASPLFAEHDGLPPALIQTAQHDPLRDQGAVYADALRAAGVDGAADQLRRRRARLHLDPGRRAGRPSGARRGGASALRPRCVPAGQPLGARISGNTGLWSRVQPGGQVCGLDME